MTQRCSHDQEVTSEAVVLWMENSKEEKGRVSSNLSQRKEVREHSHTCSRDGKLVLLCLERLTFCTSEQRLEPDLIM